MKSVRFVGWNFERCIPEKCHQSTNPLDWLLEGLEDLAGGWSAGLNCCNHYGSGERS